MAQFEESQEANQGNTGTTIDDAVAKNGMSLF